LCFKDVGVMVKIRLKKEGGGGKKKPKASTFDEKA